MKNTGRLTLVAALATAVGMFALPACSGDDTSSEELVGADESVASTTEGVSGAIAAGTTLKSTTDVNLRTGPGTSYSVLHVVPTGSQVTVVTADPQNGFYKIKHNGTTGWSSGQYYAKVATDGGGSGTLSAGRQEALKRGKSVVGFSYYWGGGAWLAEGPSSSTKGSCSGSCPSCTHSGKYGADCSGFVGKAWKVSGATGELATNQHPVSTATLVGSSSQWSTVSRGSVKPADAMVYNSGGAGHTFLYNSGDGWNSMYATECKGCSAGCIYGIRTASSAYKAIRRAGF